MKKVADLLSLAQYLRSTTDQIREFRKQESLRLAIALELLEREDLHERRV